MYNQSKPSKQFYDRAFGDLGTFAKDHHIRIVVTEFDVVQPSFGLPRQDRINFLKDFIETSRKNGISLIYMGVFDTVGLSSCLHDPGIPDHRFDTAMMALIGWGNGVTVNPPNSTVEAEDPQCHQ